MHCMDNSELSDDINEDMLSEIQSSFSLHKAYLNPVSIILHIILLFLMILLPVSFSAHKYTGGIISKGLLYTNAGLYLLVLFVTLVWLSASLGLISIINVLYESLSGAQKLAVGMFVLLTPLNIGYILLSGLPFSFTSSPFIAVTMSVVLVTVPVAILVTFGLGIYILNLKKSPFSNVADLEK